MAWGPASKPAWVSSARANVLRALTEPSASQARPAAAPPPDRRPGARWPYTRNTMFSIGVSETRRHEQSFES